jgi:hypothetical protein
VIDRDTKRQREPSVRVRERERERERERVAQPFEVKGIKKAQKLLHAFFNICFEYCRVLMMIRTAAAIGGGFRVSA